MSYYCKYDTRCLKFHTRQNIFGLWRNSECFQMQRCSVCVWLVEFLYHLHWCSFCVWVVYNFFSMISMMQIFDKCTFNDAHSLVEILFEWFVSQVFLIEYIIMLTPCLTGKNSPEYDIFWILTGVIRVKNMRMFCTFWPITHELCGLLEFKYHFWVFQTISFKILILFFSKKVLVILR